MLLEPQDPDTKDDAWTASKNPRGHALTAPECSRSMSTNRAKTKTSTSRLANLNGPIPFTP